MRLWDEINERFSRADKKKEVVKILFKYGLRITEKGEIYLGTVRIPYVSIAKAAGVDRRTVKETVNELLKSPFLKEFFSRLEPAGPFLRKVSRLLGYYCIMVEVSRDQPGILASVSGILARRGINIVQALAEDPNMVNDPKLYIITSSPVSSEALEEMLKNPIIKSITLM